MTDELQDEEEQRRERARQKITEYQLKRTRINFSKVAEIMKHPPEPGESPALWFFCPEHQDLEPPYFIANKMDGRWVRRSECQDANAKRHQDVLKKQQEKERLEAYKRCHQGFLGEQYYDNRAMLFAMTQTFQSFEAFRSREAYESVLNLTTERSGSVIITGGKGSGKTHLATALCNYHLERNMQLPPEKILQRCHPIIAPITVLYRAFNKAQFNNTDISDTELLAIITKADVMVIDDIDKLARNIYPHSENPQEMQTSSAFREFILLIIDARYRARLLTVITCNDVDQLWSYVGEFSVSRLEWNQHLIANNAPDYRPKEK